MKSLRKSLNGGKESLRAQISTPLPLPTVSKPPSAILPPQKVIRALSAYRPQAPQELPFQKGDFFYVLRDVDDQGAWYEAHNPVSGARGLVPRSMFEEFSKTPPSIRTSQVGPKGQIKPPRPDSTSPSSPKTQVFYAVVLHDFLAERADELDAKRGDTISVVAQSNREWFVAKPIGRLGRPGLIPVTFVEIRDPATGNAIEDVDALMDRGDLPKVEDWKRAMFNYKQNSIALGVIDSPNRDSVQIPTTPYVGQYSPNPPSEPAIVVQGPSPNPSPLPNKQSHSNTDPPRVDTPDALPEGILLSADVVSFHYEMDEYWFRVDAIFQPYSTAGHRDLPPAKQLILFRVYNDFYDFQVGLLDTFPREAGREPPKPRLLPYMPGPAQKVDDVITATRRAELDEYVHKLCELNKGGCKYILEHRVVREFLSMKPGDVENETEPRVQEIKELFGDSAPGQTNDYIDPLEGDDYDSEMQDTLGQMRLRDEDEKSDGSEYEDEGYAPSPQRRTHEQERHPYGQSNDRQQYNDSPQTLRQHAHSQNHQRNGSSSSFRQTPSPYAPRSGSHSRSPSPQPPRNYSSSPNPAPGRSPVDSDYNRNSDYAHYNNAPSPAPSSFRSSQAPSTRSRSHSTATSNLNTPPISAAVPQAAFVKIKIFDRVSDDLIAIRVHPLVTHAELMDKVQARLGGEVGNLRYRDSLSKDFVGLDGDDDLRAWMDGTDKHVLYAD